MTDRRLDLTSDPAADTDAQGAARSGAVESGGFLGLQFDCCGTYGRLYRDRRRHEYAGRCPRCGRRVVVGIQSGGSEARFFRG